MRILSQLRTHKVKYINSKSNFFIKTHYLLLPTRRIGWDPLNLIPTLSQVTHYIYTCIYSTYVNKTIVICMYIHKYVHTMYFLNIHALAIMTTWISNGKADANVLILLKEYYPHFILKLEGCSQEHNYHVLNFGLQSINFNYMSKFQQPPVWDAVVTLNDLFQVCCWVYSVFMLEFVYEGSHDQQQDND